MVQRLDEDTFVSVDPEQDTASDDRDHYTHACDAAATSGPKISWCGEWYVSRGTLFYGVPADGCDDCTLAYTGGAPCPRGCGWSKFGPA